ncbi:MAG: L-serine ammonia-lyase, iron-sulfur-dependent, subunit beta [Ruminococcaceae bacterium]|nr:L-serine ammonia-lyase, iron-sulfur-dependent, subunit beta [Oscillospiraceae bacterium]
MNIFDIIGPVMIGPSSSHTAGAVRLGRVANKIMDGRQPERVVITLSGSFARTYKGHGTDRALLAGILGYHSWDEEIRDALEIARARGLNYEFVCHDIPGAHPNTALIRYTLPGGEEGEVTGASVGGGNIRVDEVNGMRVDFNGDYSTILVLHLDRPGVIADVTQLMRTKYPDANIANFRLSRKERGGMSVMTIEIDGVATEGMALDLRGVENVVNALLIKRL